MSIKKFKIFEQESTEMKQLADRIYTFLSKYAGIKPDFDNKYDSDEDKYTSPDASMLRYFADSLMKGIIADRCWSEWSGGGYKPYSSREGRTEHDDIMNNIYQLIKNK